MQENELKTNIWKQWMSEYRMQWCCLIISFLGQTKCQTQTIKLFILAVKEK